MIDNKKILAIIPARGGSKGLPRKNILPLCGKPLINFSIEAALLSEYIDLVTVSTDDPEIAETAKKAGANVPFIRPAELATDRASSSDVILHCLNWHTENGIDFDYFILLQPTSPLRNSDDINAAFELLEIRNAKTIVSVCQAEHHPYGMNTLPADYNMNLFEKPEYTSLGRQQLPTYYRINGAIYLSEVNYFKEQMSFMGPNTYAMVMSKSHSVDIDDELDFEFVQFLFENRQREVQK